MKYENVLNILLGITVLTLAIGTNKKEDNKMNVNNEPVLENIFNRSSIRSYSDKEIDNSTLTKLIKAGMAAPTAGNKQPWEFIVVTDQAILQKLSEYNPYAKMVAKAPAAIVVCGNLAKGFSGIEEQFWIQDTSAASQNILLSAHSLGLGAVWTGAHPVKERTDFIKDLLDLPEKVIPLNVIAVGYPVGENKPKDKWNPENLHWNQW